ncbi:hypothetical protein [Pseudoalteromonas nigrifaciens]|uniref:hypothetical protein n=1 Tax=Pseudoalteromonas nigrifaciens TaxID=28109 RepID=UPI003FD68D32
MSVQILCNSQLSKLANYAQSQNLGSASMVGEILKTQNVKTSNARYNESEASYFTLTTDTATQEHIYDLATYYLSNSWHELDNSQALKLIVNIMRNAIHPLSGPSSFDDVLGSPIDVKGHSFSSAAYVIGFVGDYMAEVLFFDSSALEWCVTHVMNNCIKYLEQSESAQYFKLTINQVNGIKEAINKKQLIKRAKQEQSLALESKKQDEFDLKFAALLPGNAKAVIVAELKKDECGHNDDYYGSSTERRVLLGFSKHTRNLFPELKKMAGNFELTKHLVDAGEDCEHRENYSMGRGTFLTEGATYSGWVVKKETIYNKTINKAELIHNDYSPSTAKSMKAQIKRTTYTTAQGKLTVNGDEAVYSFNSKSINSKKRACIEDAGFVESSEGWVGCKSNLPRELVVEAFHKPLAGLL